ncbi:hypothetical protein Z517_01234 [Fonsecaea pedrosoi CBS 271.37]|uniref:Uncharacterized protein n=1 Tax=Fonsecaea pedrosoi CBS 271.37 TaxID=1442368 RepID=A0A0D2FGN3_9EURO|nr:uncharacterized protein Z517_01234 [Fonsecaea pedrosoi CBS 271.37]KIW85842.1 hypothetical protein Z517_01234 [Fonsecaea pedrosoi CBS 271.37]
MTCGEYITQTWPDTSSTLRLLIALISRPSTRPMREIDQVKVSLNEIETQIHFRLVGAPHTLAEICEAVAWVHAAVARTPSKKPSMVDFIVECRGNQTLSYCTRSVISPLINNLDRDTQCWLPLFPNTAVAIDCRRNLVCENSPLGLNISWDLLCFICGLEYEVDTETGFALYGQRSLVYPTRYLPTSESMQWHFQDLKKGELPPTGSFQGGERFNDLNECLTIGKDHLLGFWPEPLVTLGTEYNKDVDITKVRWTNPGDTETINDVYEKDGYTFGASISAPRLLSFNASMTYKIAHNRRNIYMSDFIGNMESIIDTPALVYSIQEGRAYVVPLISVVFHIGRVRAKVHKLSQYHVAPCEALANGGLAAFDAIRKSYQDPLAAKQPQNSKDGEVQVPYRVKDHLQSVYAALQVTVRQRSLLKRFFKEYLVGYELADIAHEYQSYNFKRHQLKDLVCWKPLVDEVHLVLFCEGLYDPIIRDPKSQAADGCVGRHHDTIPCGLDILTVSLPCLLHLSRRYNEPGSAYEWVIEGCKWHSRHSKGLVFFECDHSRAQHCQKLQSLKSKGQKHARMPDYDNLAKYQNGAIAFEDEVGAGTKLKRLSNADRTQVEPGKEWVVATVRQLRVAGDFEVALILTHLHHDRGESVGIVKPALLQTFCLFFSMFFKAVREPSRKTTSYDPNSRRGAFGVWWAF